MHYILVHMDKYNYSIMYLHIVTLCNSCNSLFMRCHSSFVSKYFKLWKKLQRYSDCFSYCSINLILTGGLDQPIRRPYVELNWRFWALWNGGAPGSFVQLITIYSQTLLQHKESKIVVNWSHWTWKVYRGLELFPPASILQDTSPFELLSWEHSKLKL